VDNRIGQVVRREARNMTDTHALLQTTSVTTAEDLAAFWTVLMGKGGFGRRTLWLVLLDDGGHPAPVVVPIDDVPEAPGRRDVEAFGAVLTGLADYGTAVLLLSRPGPVEVQPDDLRWARALAPLAPTWPVHLATAESPDAPACRVQALPSR
jgi:hypothetical protein